MLVEGLHHTREVQKRPAQSVHLVDHHAVDSAGLDVIHQLLQSRPLHVGAGEAAIVIPVWQTDPAFVLLTGDVGLARFALSVQRIELLLEPLLGAFAGVDCAANRRVHLALAVAIACHEDAVSLDGFLRPKKW